MLESDQAIALTTARDVLQALMQRDVPVSYPLTQPPLPQTEATVAVTLPRLRPLSTRPLLQSPRRPCPVQRVSRRQAYWGKFSWCLY
jgi:hypothetical protein